MAIRSKRPVIQSTQSGGARFFKVDDELNNRKFNVEIPDGYSATGLHHYFTENELEPFFTPDPTARAISMLSTFQISKAIYDGYAIGVKSGLDALIMVTIISDYLNAINIRKDEINDSPELDHILEILKYGKTILERIAGPVRIQMNKDRIFKTPGIPTLEELISRPNMDIGDTTNNYGS